MLEIHLYLLLQLDMTANSRLQFLRLHLQRCVTVDTDEVLRDKTNEILDQVVSEDGLGSSHLRIFVHLRKFSEIVLWREHGLESVEYAVLCLLANLVAGVFGRGEQCLELFYHYKGGRLCV